MTSSGLEQTTSSALEQTSAHVFSKTGLDGKIFEEKLFILTI
jgi:hypothetical protein